jgi:hypothetical protein
MDKLKKLERRLSVFLIGDSSHMPLYLNMIRKGDRRFGKNNQKHDYKESSGIHQQGRKENRRHVSLSPRSGEAGNRSRATLRQA